MISNPWFFVAALSLMANAALLFVLVAADRELRRLRISNDALVEDLADLHLQDMQRQIFHSIARATPARRSAVPGLGRVLGQSKRASWN